jgi:hypothetical protein
MSTIVNEEAASFRADMDRAGFTPAERLAFALAIGKPLASLTPNDLDLFDRFEAAFAGVEAGVR